jgi:YgiT-type zinc finger domain-containing protein
MSEKEVSKCPKCGGEMISGEVTRDVRILKHGDLVGDNIYALYCRNCGFLELYKKPSTLEPWRLPKPQETLPEEPQQPKEKTTPPTETPRKKLIR